MFIATNTALRAVYRFKTGRAGQGNFQKTRYHIFNYDRNPAALFAF
jgi:hypothetical protein